MSKAKKVNSLRGFKSIYPQEWEKWKYVRKTIEEVLESFAFKEISTPSIESRNLYKVKPPWSEGMIEETFSFFDSQGNHLTLIPEQTPTRSRMVQELKHIELPIRWFNTSKRWRQEKEIKKDRAREFWQTDADVIGCDSVESDAEILACVTEIFKKLKLRNRVDILISDRKLLENIITRVGVKKKNYYEAVKIIDDKEKINKKEFQERFENIGLNREEIRLLYEIISLKGPIKETVREIQEKYRQTAKRGMERLDRILSLSELLETYKIYDICKLDLSIARGSFYTGLIFEVFDKDKIFGALAGGGRYDWLVSMYGDKDLPAIGFGFGHLGVVQKLKKDHLFDNLLEKKRVFVFCENKKDYEFLIKLVKRLREKNYKVEADVGYRADKDKDFYMVIKLKNNFLEKKKIEIQVKKVNKKFTVKGFDRCVRKIASFFE